MKFLQDNKIGLLKPARLQRGFINPGPSLFYKKQSGGGGGDPYWDNVVSLLHFNGTDGSTIFTDQKGSAWTANGAAKLSTSQKKFGTASLSLPDNNSTISTANATLLRFGANDFTIEMFIRPSILISGDAYSGVVISNDSPNTGQRAVLITVTKARQIQSNVYVGSTSYGPDYSGGALFNWDDTFHHIALTRSGTTLNLFFDGSIIMSSTLPVAAVVNTGATSGTVIGSDPGFPAGQTKYSGYIDGVRVTNGVGRYIANFTPPTAPFPDHA